MKTKTCECGLGYHCLLEIKNKKKPRIHFFRAHLERDWRAGTNASIMWSCSVLLTSLALWPGTHRMIIRYLPCSAKETCSYWDHRRESLYLLKTDEPWDWWNKGTYHIQVTVFDGMPSFKFSGKVFLVLVPFLNLSCN